ncbi:hypothetical protein [Caballeronia mineralivorans]|uniref:hypothetical protein n=1 Tax=Caballeronia mineralivorans TaxID=2010198 RepID=UPI0023F27BE8|nr:hypothetical protein [Caballeronia mineralivorans]
MLVRDVTEARAVSELLSRQATHDELTGLINRRELLLPWNLAAPLPANGRF